MSCRACYPAPPAPRRQLGGRGTLVFPASSQFTSGIRCHRHPRNPLHLTFAHAARARQLEFLTPSRDRPPFLYWTGAGRRKISSCFDYKGTGLHNLLNNEAIQDDFDSERSPSPFSVAGFFSKMSFWWMNPLVEKGYRKPLEEKDIPLLDVADQAGTQYAMFVNKINARKLSLFWAIVSCYKMEILFSGFFALLKVLTMSSGPLLVKEFINVSSGKEAFKHEGVVLALGLLLCKCLESLAQRQWYFQTRRVGIQVRSLLSAAIYRKQQKLSCVASIKHSSGEIMNYLIVDAYRVGEFPFWFHRTWTTGLQLGIALTVLYNAVGPATIASVLVILLTLLLNAPLARQQQDFYKKLMKAQDMRLKAMSESLVNMKVLKLYAWEAHFKSVIEHLRELELKWLSAFQLGKAYTSVVFWASPALVSAATFIACYFLGVPLDPVNVFTFIAALRLVQDPINHIPNVIGSVIQARVAFSRISSFLGESELQKDQVSMEHCACSQYPIVFKYGYFSWDSSGNSNLRNINLEVKAGTKVAICGEVGSGKSTLLAAILGEVPKTEGMSQVCGKVAYVSQDAWIQTGSLQENILFGSNMDKQRYKETLRWCSLVHDLESLPFGDLTQIGERGVNLSGGQKQRVQLARALYYDADIYLLDDPFSSVDAGTAASLLNVGEYVMGALSKKTVLLVTHKVEFLHAFDSVVLMSHGQIMHAASYQELLVSSKQFQDLVNAHEVTTDFPNVKKAAYYGGRQFERDVSVNHGLEKEYVKSSVLDQLIKTEEREFGDTGLKPYLMYLKQNKGYIYASLVAITNIIFASGQVFQNSWLAANVQNPCVSTLNLVLGYTAIGCGSIIFLLSRALFVVNLGLRTSRPLCDQLLSALFRAPMSFFHSTPLGRIVSRVSSDLSIVDLDLPFTMSFSICSTLNAYINLGVLCFFTWQTLLVAAPVIIMSVKLQRYYLASSKELMRINGTTKSLIANHLGESIAGAVTIRAFKQEHRFFARSLELIDNNASPSFHCFAATEWLTQRLEIMGSAILSASALVITLRAGTYSPGDVGMLLSYGLSLNMLFLFSIQNQCSLANQIISVERLGQYIGIVSEAPYILKHHQPPDAWPSVGKIELKSLEIKYNPDASPVLHGITCTFQGGDKIGIVGRTGCGKTTLINAIFRLVEPSGGKIIIDGHDITAMGLYDLRSRIGLIPQDPILFYGSIRHNLDPQGHFSDEQIWEVVGKCQLIEAVKEKQGLDSHIVEGGSNWSMGQRQLLCLGRALLRRSRILILDEATASIDNATDAIIQKIIRTEFKDSTVITVAHRIPTVMDCTRVLVINNGKMVEYHKPQKLMQTEGSFFKDLLNEYMLQASKGGL